MADFDYSIFALAQTLTKNESKKVSSFLKDMGTQHAILQLELFETLRLSRSDDEENMKTRLRSTELLNYLSYHKDKLKDHILSVLWSNDQGLIRQSQEISDTIDRCVILRHRGFGQKAIQELDKVANKIDSDLFPELKLRAYSELSVMLRNSQNRLESDVLKNHTERILGLIQGMETSTRLLLMSERAYALYSWYRRSGNSELNDELTQILEDPLLSHPPVDAGFMAIHRYYLALVFVNNIKGEQKKVIDSLEACRSEWLAHTAMLEAQPQVYAGVVVNLLNLYLGEGEFEKFEDLHAETSKLHSNDRMHQAEIQSRITCVWLLYLLNRKLSTKVHELNDEFVRQIAVSEKIVSPNVILNLMYNFAILWYVSDEPQKASMWLKRIVASKFKVRYDLKGVAEILLTLLTLDGDNPDYTLSAHRKIKRFYNMHRIENDLSEAVLNFLNVFAKAKSTKDELKAIETLSEKLKSLESSDLAIIGKNEVSFWTESRLTGKSIRSAWLAS
ncbi:MAG: hypothetical protein KBF73_04430 [Flavobacteriales bacterium]|nr:hypothetical protein [Flavobacteriales bacterium]